MTVTHNSKPIAVHTWDWKGQPNFKVIRDIIIDFMYGYGIDVNIEEVETGCDEYAIVLGEVTKENAKQYYDQHTDEDIFKDFRN